MSLENLFGNFIIHLLFLFITTSNVRFADSADCHNKVIVSAPLIRNVGSVSTPSFLNDGQEKLY